jgi:hypothetical protein
VCECVEFFEWVKVGTRLLELDRVYIFY